jgi:hypothetical protein
VRAQGREGGDGKTGLDWAEWKRDSALDWTGLDWTGLAATVNRRGRIVGCVSWVGVAKTRQHEHVE